MRKPWVYIQKDLSPVRATAINQINILNLLIVNPALFAWLHFYLARAVALTGLKSFLYTYPGLTCLTLSGTNTQPWADVYRPFRANLYTMNRPVAY